VFIAPHRLFSTSSGPNSGAALAAIIDVAKDPIDSIAFSSIPFVSFVLATCRRFCLVAERVDSRRPSCVPCCTRAEGGTSTSSPGTDINLAIHLDTTKPGTHSINYDVAETMRRFDGFVAKYLGDGIVTWK
jgi:hypothetical protein